MKRVCTSVHFEKWISTKVVILMSLSRLMAQQVCLNGWQSVLYCSYIFSRGFDLCVVVVLHSKSQGSPETAAAALKYFFHLLISSWKSGFSWPIVVSWQMGSSWSSGVSPPILAAVPPLSLGIAAHLLWLTGLPVLSSWGNFASVGRALFNSVWWTSHAHLPVSLWLLWVSILYLYISIHLS